MILKSRPGQKKIRETYGKWTKIVPQDHLALNRSFNSQKLVKADSFLHGK